MNSLRRRNAEETLAHEGAVSDHDVSQSVSLSVASREPVHTWRYLAPVYTEPVALLAPIYQ